MSCLLCHQFFYSLIYIFLWNVVNHGSPQLLFSYNYFISENCILSCLSLGKRYDVHSRRLFQERRLSRTLISFQVGPSDFNTLVVVLKPLCEGPMKDIQSQSVQSPCCNLHLLSVFKTTDLKVQLQLGKQPKVTGSNG